MRGSIKINKKPNDTETKYYQKVLNLWDNKLYKKHQKLMILTVQFLRYAIKQDSILINCQYHAIGFKILENPRCLLWHNNQHIKVLLITGIQEFCGIFNGRLRRTQNAWKCRGSMKNIKHKWQQLQLVKLHNNNVTTLMMLTYTEVSQPADINVLYLKHNCDTKTKEISMMILILFSFYP